MNPDKLWSVSEPVFESDKINPALRFAYWAGHRGFAYDLLRFVQPRVIVELGSQYGCSLFSFCQSVKDNALDCTIHAVDVWAGDVGAPDAGEEVLRQVRSIQKTYFESVDLRLYPMLFCDAAPLFEENSVDLIHIDGGHRFEDVQEDFETWLPKLRENGIILFHDVFSPIDSGSCEHWKYIKEKYHTHFEFPHSCGLGVLFPKGDHWYRQICEAGFFPYIHDLYRYRAEYEYNRDRLEELSGLYSERYAAIEEQSRMIDERDKTIKSQAALIDARDEEIRAQTAMIDERDKTIKSQAALIDARDEEIRVQTAMIDERDKTIRSQAALIDARDEEVKTQTRMIDDRDKTIKSQAAMIDERDKTIKSQAAMIDERDKTIKSQATLIDARDEEVKTQAVMIDERDKTIKDQAAMIDARDETIQSQAAMINARDEVIRSQASMIDERNEIIRN